MPPRKRAASSRKASTGSKKASPSSGDSGVPLPIVILIMLVALAIGIFFMPSEEENSRIPTTEHTEETALRAIEIMNENPDAEVIDIPAPGIDKKKP